MISEFAKEKVFWTRKMNLKLVKFIENNPNIWNPNHPKYTSIEYRDQTYAAFASKYGNEFTGQAVKERWTNIRSTFANYLRKLKASRTKEDSEVYKIRWHLWDACSFLLNLNKKKKMRKSSACLEEDTKDNTDCKDEEFSSYEYDLSNKSTIDEDLTCQNVANGILNVFRGVQNNAFNISNSEYENVGQVIVNKLNEMSSYKAQQISNKIMNILLLYHEDNPYNPNNVV